MQEKDNQQRVAASKETTEPRGHCGLSLSHRRKFYGRHHDRYGISVSQMTTNIFRLSYSQSSPFLIHDLSMGFQPEWYDGCY